MNQCQHKPAEIFVEGQVRHVIHQRGNHYEGYGVTEGEVVISPVVSKNLLSLSPGGDSEGSPRCARTTASGCKSPCLSVQ